MYVCLPVISDVFLRIFFLVCGLETSFAVLSDLIAII